MRSDRLRVRASLPERAEFPGRDSTSALDPTMHVLWAQANACAGYRYTVEDGH